MNKRKHPQKGEDLGLSPTSQPYFSTAVRVDAGPLLFISGMVSRDEQRRIVAPGDIRGQTRCALERLRKVLAANHASIEDVVNITIYSNTKISP